MQIGQAVTLLFHRLGNTTRQAGMILGISDNATLAAPGGEPAVTAILLKSDPVSAQKLSGADWHEAMDRQVAVLHDSHPDVADGKAGISYIETSDAVDGLLVTISDADKPWYMDPATLRQNVTALAGQLGMGEPDSAQDSMTFFADAIEGMSKDLSTLRSSMDKNAVDAVTIQQLQQTITSQADALTQKDEEITTLKGTISDLNNTVEQKDDEIVALQHKVDTAGKSEPELAAPPAPVAAS